MTDGTATADHVLALAAAPASGDAGVCFLARSSGLYRSADGGRTWHAALAASPDATAPPSTTSVAVSPDFAVDRTVFAGGLGGVLRSFDGGRSWRVAALPGPPPPLVSALAVSPAFGEDGTLLAGTFEDGVFRSTDRGATWAPANVGLIDLTVLAMAISPGFGSDRTVVIGTESGIFRSGNGGKAWKELDFPDELAPVTALALAGDDAGEQTLLAGTEARGLWRSTDRGQTWALLLGDDPPTDVGQIVLSPRFPAEPDILVVAGGRLLVSRDRGQPWVEWDGADLGDAEIAAIATPEGIGPGAPVLVGLADGRVVTAAAG